MSIEETWDLLSRDQLRSFCVFAAPDGAAASASHNPFDAAVSEASARAVAAVFGTATGSLHYRAFAPAPRHGAPGLGPGAAPPPQRPLGAAHRSGPTSPGPTGPALPPPPPRSHLPVDSAAGLLPGPVVACHRVAPQVFLLLVDDQNPDRAAASDAARPAAAARQHCAAYLASLEQGHWRLLTPAPARPGAAATAAGGLLPRMTSAVWSRATGLVYTAGRTLASLNGLALGPGELPHSGAFFWPQDSGRAGPGGQKQSWFHATLPAPGARSGADSLALTANGQVAVCAVGNEFFAVAAVEANTGAGHHGYTDGSASRQSVPTGECVKVLSFSQSSHVHAAIVVDVPDPTLDLDWYLIFLANGRDCAVVDLYYSYAAAKVSFCKQRHGHVTCASPILAAAASRPWIAILTSDGLLSIRSPSCLAISLRTVEIGGPNDYFCLRTRVDDVQTWMVAASHSGVGKVLQCHADTAQDNLDRLMRLSIDALGTSGFPRVELAEAIHASFTATSYVGPEPNPQARLLLQQYLEAILGLADFASGGKSGWPTDHNEGQEAYHGVLALSTSSGRGVAQATAISASTPDATVAATALLCLVCMHVSPPQSGLANRASKQCSEKLGVVFEGQASIVSVAGQLACEMIAERMLKESSSLISLVSGSSPTPISRGAGTSQASMQTEFVEAAIWLLRACGKHERAIDVAYERLHRGHGQVDETGVSARGVWSRIKYESYIATHLSEIWASGNEHGSRLVIRSPATRRLLESNPRLGLSVFTASHPQNELQWRDLRTVDEPFARPEEVKSVLSLLKSTVPSQQQTETALAAGLSLPLDSGRALAISFLESAVGMETGRTDYDEYSSLPMDARMEEHISDFHDELSFLLLEGVITEKRDDSSQEEVSELGKIYHEKLRKFLRWPLAKIRTERFMETLPSSFLQEKALIFGRLDQHEKALRILFHDLGSLELSLDYCDDRFERLKSKQGLSRFHRNHAPDSENWQQSELGQDGDDDVYLPLIRVALDSEDRDRGMSAAIQVLALRRGAIDRAAALRLLPSNVPVSAVARPFLIPALVDSESQVRRLTVVSALLRARYLRLKDRLTAAQLKVQSNLYTVPQFNSLNLGEPLHSTNPFRVRTNGAGGSLLPDVLIVKHFFHRHLVIQAKITNTVGLSDKLARNLTDIAFIVAESSDDAIQPVMQIPIQRLPPKMTGCAWFVLSAAPSRMEGPTAQLTCELRYNVHSSDAWSGFAGSLTSTGSAFVEELQDLEVHSAHFS